MAFSKFFPEAQKELLAATIKAGGDPRSMGTQTDGLYIIVAGSVILKPSEVFITTADNREFDYLWNSFEKYDYIPVFPDMVGYNPNSKGLTTTFISADGKKIVFDTRRTLMVFRTKFITKQYLEENDLFVDAAEDEKGKKLVVMRVRHAGEIVAYLTPLVGCTT